MSLFGGMMKGRIRNFMEDHARDIGEVIKDYLHIEVNIDEENFTFSFTCEFGGVIICEYEKDISNLIENFLKSKRFSGSRLK